MGTAGGPNVTEDGLVLCLDAANNKSISPAANEEFNNSDQFVKNLISRGQSITANNGVKVGNLNYYTAFAIDYPETSFGGVAAGRDGVTAGFNVTSGTKTHEYGRALHFHIWDDSAGGWISNSNFNGDGSFRYDTWGGYANASTQVAQFVTDYNNLKVIYPNDTFIVAGSHRDSTHTTDKINVLLDLGAPSNVSSLLDGSPEWILVGKPGLGAGNAYVWAFENGNTGDAIRVAHAVFPLPINKINKDNYFEFDNTDDYIQLPNDLGYTSSAVSVFCWYKINGNPAGNYHILCGGQELELSINVSHSYIRNGLRTTSGRFVQNDGNVSLNDGNWHFYGFTYDGSTKRAYIDGVQVGTQSITGTLTTSFNRTLGRFGTDTSYFANGKMAKYEVYSRSLSASEVLQNYNAIKGRFDL